MGFFSSDCLKIRLVLCLTIVTLLHLAGFAISLPKTETLYEDVAVGVVLVPWQQDDVAVDANPVKETTVAQQPAVAEIPPPVNNRVIDKLSEPSVSAPALTENQVFEEELPEILTEDVLPVLLQGSFEPSENLESAQPAVVAPEIGTDTTAVAAAEVATETTKEAAAPRSDQQARPRYGHHPPPAYPRIARQRGWQGDVEYEVRVLPTGRVADLVLKSSSGYRILDEAARKAITQWQFSPATRSGTPIESWVVIPVEFVLDGH